MGVFSTLSLKPKDIANKIIVVGDSRGVHRISRFFDFLMVKREFISHTGKYNAKRMSVVSPGMRTNNGESIMHELDTLFKIDLVRQESRPRKKKLQMVRIDTSDT